MSVCHTTCPYRAASQFHTSDARHMIQSDCEAKQNTWKYIQMDNTVHPSHILLVNSKKRKNTLTGNAISLLVSQVAKYSNYI